MTDSGQMASTRMSAAASSRNTRSSRMHGRGAQRGELEEQRQAERNGAEDADATRAHRIRQAFRSIWLFSAKAAQA